MDRADAGAGQHRHCGLGNHRHVNEYAVLCLDTVFLKDVGKTANVLLELSVSDDPLVAGFTFPDDRRLVATCTCGVAVHAVFTDVELAAVEPLGIRRLPIEHLGPRLLPNQFLRLARPEYRRLLDGFLVKALVRRHGWDAGFGRKLFGWLDGGASRLFRCEFLSAHGLIEKSDLKKNFRILPTS